ncbi:MAG TPA: tyrosine-type recombinase/integrase, partial [Amnibacterium sp.]|uniref:tyrosine-type recombinase/integrase n=1 Tax=Amnibacterium sp. TaxID=1872496 RepID=UPI002F94A65C
GFRTKKDAELFLAITEVAMVQGRYVAPEKARITLSEWLDTWLATRVDMRASSRTRVVGIVEKYVRPQLGAVPLGRITRLQAQQWASGLPGSPQSVRKAVNVLSGALQLAVDDGRLPANPAHRLKLPRSVKTSKRYLTHDEVAALALAVGEQPLGRELGYDLIVLVLAYCGLRWGELAGLRVGDIDLVTRRLVVRQTMVMDNGRPHVEAPKDYEHRSIAIPPFLATLLLPHLAGKAPADPVFIGARTATYLRNAVFRHGWFNPAAAAIGLDGLTPHELRHTAASLAVGSGANVKAVQRMLGHASAAMTLDTYTDLFDDDLEAVATALDHRAMQTDVAKLLPRSAKRPPPRSPGTRKTPGQTGGFSS